jgi:hypothetical protein
MSNIVLSGLVGLLSYYILSSNKKKSDIEIALDTEASERPIIKKSYQYGGDLCTDVNSNYSNHPDCFEICKIAIDIFNELQYIDKCGNKAYNLLAKLYSEIFCFEMALGNNNLNLVEDAKVDNKINEILKEYPNLDKKDALNKYLKESFKKVEALVQNDEREWYVMRRLTLKHLRTMIPIKESEYYDFIDYCHFSIKYIKWIKIIIPGIQ